MNPLFALGEEFRFHDSSRFRKKAGDAKLRFYHSLVPVLMSLAAESCLMNVHEGLRITPNPHLTCPSLFSGINSCTIGYLLDDLGPSISQRCED